MWIDTHCHLDAAEFDADRPAVRARATAQGVDLCVLPSVSVANMATVRALAHTTLDAYALGIHPLCVPDAADHDLAHLRDALAACGADPRLVAVGEIGLDFFVPRLCRPDLRDKQERYCRAQLVLARELGLPVVLHVRRSADRLLKHLRDVAGPGGRWQGIAHAFNGSMQQAEAFVALGFKLGFGGAVTFERARQLRALACGLPLDALVLETDSPDIPPHWLYATQAERAAGTAQGRNEPGELPRIAQTVANLRGLAPEVLAAATTANALAALPRLRRLLPPWTDPAAAC